MSAGRPEIKNLRALDLVRYMRAELHQANLLTDDEYFQICQWGAESGSVKRLESYDNLRQQLAEAQADSRRLDWLEQWAEACLMRNDEGAWELEVCCPARSTEASTLRQAIDQAQTSAGEKPQPENKS